MNKACKITFLCNPQRNNKTFNKGQTYKAVILGFTLFDSTAYYLLELETGDIITIPESFVEVTVRSDLSRV